MNTTMKTILMCALLTMGTAASAQEATPDNWITEFKSVLTRAEVRAELALAHASGEMARLKDEGYVPVLAQSTKTRAEVRAELHQARGSGQLAQLSAEAYDFAPRQADGARPLYVASGKQQAGQ